MSKTQKKAQQSASKKKTKHNAGESFYDRNKHLIGSVSSGLGDLSSNKEYMKGFGTSKNTLHESISQPNAQLDERDIFLRGKTVILKALTERDIQESGWYGWFNDEETTEFMQQRYFPNTLHKQLEFYRSSIAGASNKVQLGIVPLSPTGEPASPIVGVVSLSGIDFMNRKAEFGIVIGAKEARGKGYGTEATELILQHGFERLSLNKVYLGVHAEHKAAIRSYEKAGFKIDGVLRQDMLFAGKYVDTVVMSILAEEYWVEQKNKKQ